MTQEVGLTLECSSQSDPSWNGSVLLKDEVYIFGRLRKACEDAYRSFMELPKDAPIPDGCIKVVNDQEVSSSHCRIWFDKTTHNFMVVDLGSMCGTYFAKPANQFQREFECIGSRENKNIRPRPLGVMCALRLAKKTFFVVKKIDGGKFTPYEAPNARLLEGETMESNELELVLQVISGPGANSSVVIRYPETCLVGRASSSQHGNTTLRTVAATSVGKKSFPDNAGNVIPECTKMFPVEDKTSKLSRKHFVIAPDEMPHLSYSENFTVTLVSNQGGTIVKAKNVPDTVSDTLPEDVKQRLKWRALEINKPVNIGSGDLIRGGKTIFRVANNLGPPGTMEAPFLETTQNDPAPCMHLKWRRPFSATEIRHYILEMSLTGSEKGLWESVYAGSDLEATVQRRTNNAPIEDGRPYYFRVCAENAGGKSPFSPVVCFSTYSLFNQRSESSDTADDDEAEIVSSAFDYTRVRLLGRGAFGEVWLVQNVKDCGQIKRGTLMALKSIQSFARDDESLEAKTKKVEREILLMSRLEHPNVVRYLGASRKRVTDQCIAIEIFMEFVPHGSLREHVKASRRSSAIPGRAIPEDICRMYASEIVEGLAYLHSQMVMHRDIKSDNVLLKVTDGVPECKITDFGCSRSLRSLGSAPEAESTLTGTPAFMAPEVIKQRAVYQSDVWSVGCTVLEMLTGDAPWTAEMGAEREKIMWVIATTTTGPEIPDFVSEDCRSFLAACFAIDTEKRPSALQLLQHRFIDPNADSPHATRSPRMRPKPANLVLPTGDVPEIPVHDWAGCDFPLSPVSLEGFPMSPLTLDAESFPSVYHPAGAAAARERGAPAAPAARAGTANYPVSRAPSDASTRSATPKASDVLGAETSSTATPGDTRSGPTTSAASSSPRPAVLVDDGRSGTRGLSSSGTEPRTPTAVPSSAPSTAPSTGGTVCFPDPSETVSRDMEGRSDTMEISGPRVGQSGSVSHAGSAGSGASGSVPRGLVTIPHEDLLMVEELGSGAFGKVSKYKYLGAEVAVKTLLHIDSRHFDELINEATMLRNINHPKCIQFMGLTVVNEELQQYGIVTEYMAGGDLYSILHKEGTPLTRRSKFLILCDVVRALVFLHAKSIIHRDIKPGNILLDEQKTIAKLADFGLSAPGRTGGTARYAAPEVHAKGEVDKASDVYSLGVVSYELFTGEKPFGHIKATEIGSRRAPGEAPGKVDDDDPRFPPGFVPLMRRCWSAHPAERPEASAILLELEAMEHARGGAGPTPYLQWLEGTDA